MATHFSILAWRTLRTEEPGRLQTYIVAKSNTTEQLIQQHIVWASPVAQWSRIHLPVQEMWVWSLDWEGPLEKEMSTHSSILGLEDPMDRGAWGATVHGVTKSWTRLSVQATAAGCYVMSYTRYYMSTYQDEWNIHSPDILKMII